MLRYGSCVRRRILRSQVSQQRLILSPEERSQLLAIGRELEHQVKGLISVVRYRTYQRWVKEQQEGRQPGRVDHIVQRFVVYYNEHRPHQGVGNRLLGSANKPKLQLTQREEPIGSIGYQSELGGLLKHYYRQAA